MFSLNIFSFIRSKIILFTILIITKVLLGIISNNIKLTLVNNLLLNKPLEIGSKVKDNF
jgi:hypothetical protein